MDKLMNIYNLGNEVANLKELMLRTADEDGTIDEELVAYFENCKGHLEEGCLQFGQMVKSIEAFLGEIANEQARLKEMSDKLKNRAERAKERLTTEMANAGLKKLENVNVTITIRDSQKTIIVDESKVPMEFKKIETKVEEKIDKTAIKNAIKGGAEVEGAFVQDCKNITIK